MSKNNGAKPKPPAISAHGKKIGRPLADVDPATVEQLAAIDCSYAEMAAVLSCSEDTLLRRFADVIKRGRENGKASLKRKQFKLAMDGNATMLIWLGKQRLGQSDRQEYRIGNLAQLSDDELKRLAAGEVPLE